MEMEAADAGPASNGPCSPTEEHARMLVDLSVTVPARQHDSPDEPMIKQEEGTEEAGEKNGLEEAGQNEEEASGLEEPMTDGPNNVPDGESRTVGSCDAGTRLPNAGDERPFHCSQCGVSFTQKGNLLRHVKLHSGEKPFKCPFCSYACRRRDALTGHLRTHSVGKPHKCNLCGRSYKQRASLEEHKERCHSYMQRVNANSAPHSGQYQEEPLKEQQPLMDAVSIAPFDRPPVIERLQANVGKRKSTTPQKFVGEKLMRYGYPEQPYDMALKYEKEVDLLQAQIMDPTISSGVSYLGSDAMRPLLHHPALTLINPLFPQNYSLGPRDAPLPPPPPPELPPTSNGPLSLVRPKNHPARHGESPGNSRPGSAGSERASPPGRAGQRPGHAPWPGASPPRRQREAAEAEDQKLTRECLRVFSREGRQLRTFRCHHCHLLYLDHVMYTIHMGCHGYRDPFECNICGHRSQDRYEFSSHIVRGEHTFQ